MVSITMSTDTNLSRVTCHFHALPTLSEFSIRNWHLACLRYASSPSLERITLNTVAISRQMLQIKKKSLERDRAEVRGYCIASLHWGHDSIPNQTPTTPALINDWR